MNIILLAFNKCKNHMANCDCNVLIFAMISASLVLMSLLFSKDFLTPINRKNILYYISRKGKIDGHDSHEHDIYH